MILGKRRVNPSALFAKLFEVTPRAKLLGLKSRRMLRDSFNNIK
jgi:hypothetical protein